VLSEALLAKRHALKSFLRETPAEITTGVREPSPVTITL
jgi:S-adenosylmethionine decarboxylase